VSFLLFLPPFFGSLLSYCILTIVCISSNPELRAQLCGFLYTLCCKRHQPASQELEEQAIQFLLPILLSLVDSSPIDQWLNVCGPPLSSVPPPPLVPSRSVGLELSREQENAALEVARGLNDLLGPGLRGLQFALEILTNIYTSPEDSNKQEDDDETEGAEDEMQEDVNMEEEGASEASPLTSPTLQSELANVLGRVLPRAAPIPAPVLKLAGEWPTLLKPSGNPSIFTFSSSSSFS
jgi:hypothetical protein